MGTGPARDEGPARPDPACGQQDRNAVGRPSATAQILSPTDRTGNRRRVVGSGQNSLQRVRARADRSDHARAARLHDGRGSADDRALLNTVNDIYESKPQSRRKSIRGYVQTAKIVVWIIAGILIVSILIGRDPTDLLLGLGASAALVSLVFKDTILGFVASIQLSAQDMIRPGDWIEMPSKGADGVVSEINVNSVKVRNWDNTMTMIPIYSLVSESFTNWRNMEESAGRRFKRPLRIDATTVSTLSEEQLTALTADPRIAELAEAMLILDRQTGTSPVPDEFRLVPLLCPDLHGPTSESRALAPRTGPLSSVGRKRPDVGNIRLLDRKIVSGLRASGSRPAQPPAGGHARFRTAAIPTAGRSLRLRVRKPFPDNKRFRASRKRNSAGLTRSPDKRRGRGAHGAPLPL